MIYLDHHATTPVDPRVLEAMLPFFSEKFGNPSSRTHRSGWDASDAVERARKQVAALIGASAREIVFTSGATEANNLAIAGVAAAAPARSASPRDGRHRAQGGARPVPRARSAGLAGDGAAGGRDGLVDLAAVEQAVTPGTALVSVMAANNEIGVVQPLADIARLAHAQGASCHTDAVQALGKLPLDVARPRRRPGVVQRAQDVRPQGRRRPVCEAWHRQASARAGATAAARSAGCAAAP